MIKCSYSNPLLSLLHMLYGAAGHTANPFPDYYPLMPSSTSIPQHKKNSSTPNSRLTSIIAFELLSPLFFSSSPPFSPFSPSSTHQPITNHLDPVPHALFAVAISANVTRRAGSERVSAGEKRSVTIPTLSYESPNGITAPEVPGFDLEML